VVLARIVGVLLRRCLVWRTSEHSRMLILVLSLLLKLLLLELLELFLQLCLLVGILLICGVALALGAD